METTIKTNSLPIIVFDLDGTLVDTDEANGLAYQKAVYESIGKHITLDGGRITRETLRETLNLDVATLNRIAYHKESIFEDYLDRTNPLPALQIVQHLSDANVVLLTLARKKRAISVLKYHHALSSFNNMYFKEDYDGASKFEYLRKQLSSNFEQVILFENEQEMITDAIKHGIHKRNIYQQL